MAAAPWSIPKYCQLRVDSWSGALCSLCEMQLCNAKVLIWLWHLLHLRENSLFSLLQTSLIFAPTSYLLFNLGAILMLEWWEGVFTEDLQAMQLMLFPFWSMSQCLKAKLLLLELWFMASLWINAIFLSVFCFVYSEEETLWNLKHF